MIRRYEIERMGKATIGEIVEYDDARLMVSKWNDCGSCYFKGSKKCSLIPCDKYSRADEQDVEFIEIEE